MGVSKLYLFKGEHSLMDYVYNAHLYLKHAIALKMEKEVTYKKLFNTHFSY